MPFAAVPEMFIAVTSLVAAPAAIAGIVLWNLPPTDSGHRRVLAVLAHLGL